MFRIKSLLLGLVCVYVCNYHLFAMQQQNKQNNASFTQHLGGNLHEGIVKSYADLVSGVNIDPHDTSKSGFNALSLLVKIRNDKQLDDLSEIRKVENLSYKNKLFNFDISGFELIEKFVKNIEDDEGKKHFINKRNKTDKNTALHYLIIRAFKCIYNKELLAKHVQAIEFLVENGADLFIKNAKKESPINLALFFASNTTEIIFDSPKIGFYINVCTDQAKYHDNLSAKLIVFLYKKACEQEKNNLSENYYFPLQ